MNEGKSGINSIYGVEEYRKKIQFIQKLFDKDMITPEQYAEIGKYMISNPEILGHIIATLIDRLGPLEEDNNKHRQNANSFIKMAQAYNYNFSLIELQMKELISKMEASQPNGEVNPVCECGHLSCDHTGNSNCTHCECKIFRARK